MNENLMEFWGNFLLAAARSKKQSDQFAEWLKKGTAPGAADWVKPFTDWMQQFPESGVLMEQFRKLYGLERVPAQSDDYQEMVAKALQDFQEYCNSALSMMGMVSRSEYLKLVEKYEVLKLKCAEQDETIQHLRLLLKQKAGVPGEMAGEIPGEMAGQFAEMFRNQGEFFQGMFKGFLDAQYHRKAETDQKPSSKGNVEDDAVYGSDPESRPEPEPEPEPKPESDE
jgi:hypothetical protein